MFNGRRQLDASLAVFSIVACGACASVACGQFQQTTYDVEHTFTWMPPPGATHVPTVTGYFFQHAWVRERGFFQAWGAAPLPQGAGFDPFGRDFGAAMGMINVSQPTGTSVPCVFGFFNIPTTGLLSSGPSCLQVVGPRTVGTACVEFDVSPFGAGTPVQGRIRSAGSAQAAGPQAEAYAASGAGLTIRDTSPAGTVQWQPFMDMVSDSSYAMTQRRDPIEIVAVDVAGNTASAVVLEIDFVSDSDGRMNWSNGTWRTDAQDGLFTMRLGGPPIRNPGELVLQIRNGVVTRSRSNGSLAFPLPPIGTTVPIMFPLPNSIPVDYDAAGFGLPDVVNDVTLNFLGNGEGPVNGGNCAADFNGDGNLDPDDLGDYINCFFSLPPCEAADFNADGNVDPDDLGDFINAFFAGCEG
ncbi:MAG: hypothetical protein AB7K52_12240 [Phycisphaerales bacterium]